MKIYKGADYEEVSNIVADLVAQQVKHNPESVLGLATGSTPIGAYDKLVSKYEKGELDFEHIKTVNLDEYKGIQKANPQSYRYFMNEHLFSRVNIDLNNTFFPNGEDEDSERACKEYEKILDGIGSADVQLLGLGLNGHIGFNEPSEHFTDKTFCVNLTESTIQANARFFDSFEEVPKQAYTMGIDSIMKAKTIILIVTGEAKRDILKKAFFEGITPLVPASILQKHQNLILVGDEAALGNNFQANCI